MAVLLTETSSETVVTNVGRTITTSPVTIKANPINTPTIAKDRLDFFKKKSFQTDLLIFHGNIENKGKNSSNKKRVHTA